jgi:L-asparaginase
MIADYQFYEINQDKPQAANATSVLVIYTGGTLGMVFDAKDKTLKAFQFSEILKNVPEISRFDFRITILPFNTPFDSSNVTPEIWLELAQIIKENYPKFDAFVILHGTDTMAYTASALSFLLENLSKPVILTGAQLPIGVARTDARENLMTALEIAADTIDGRPVVPEVAIYFNSRLIRGNRAKKLESSQFNAFHSENYPLLAEVGITIDYKFPYIRSYRPDLALKTHTKMDKNVVVLSLFPGICEKVVHSILSIEGLKGVILQTYGAGNSTTEAWFTELLRAAIEKNIVILNVSQCSGGRVVQGAYETSKHLEAIGVISGADLTTEAAITKMMYLFGKETDVQRVRFMLQQGICGEMTENP